MESVFECSVREGLVGPGSSVQVPVFFSPVAVDSSSVEYLCLSSPGALSKQLLKLTGSCCGLYTLNTHTVFSLMSKGQNQK